MRSAARPKSGDWCIIEVRRNEKCGREAVATVSINCVNEFPGQGRLCGAHVKMAQQGVMGCFHCADTGRGQHNVFVTKVVWDK
jgi:hypothetical protein